MFKVSFINENKVIEVDEGSTILDAEIAAGLTPDAPCGGMGVCGKCLVDVIKEDGPETVKACSTPVLSDIKVMTLRKDGDHMILTESEGEIGAVDPAVKAVEISIEKATLDSPTSEWRRVSSAVKSACGTDIRPDPMLAQSIKKTLEELGYTAQAVLYHDELLSLRRGGRLLSAAVDIGTTTVVLYLADTVTGKVIATNSMLNPQTEFGADVISRANYAMQNSTEKLSVSIRGAINELLHGALETAEADASDVFSIVAVGNTCMHHLFLGIDPTSLVLSPYVPATDEALVLNASDYDIAINPRGKLFVLPCIAGFVGADTASVMLACEFDRREDLTLAIDIGTNGELVIGDRYRTLACSTAAGPAFEGAKITFGMRGAVGAIDHASYDNGRFEYTVIGGGKAIGICGSGLIDITAALLKSGILDETGRFADDDEVPYEARDLTGRLRNIDGMRCFVLAEEDESDHGRCVYLSQKDIREVQLAKGAMAAGIGLMLEHLGKKPEDVKEVMIAGAFGNYMSSESACAIGLLPEVLLDRVKAVGNAAGRGALICALNESAFYRTIDMVAKTEFIELASNSNFQDRFVDELMFPESEL